MKRLILNIFSAFFISTSVFALTLSDLETRVRRNVRDTDSTLQRYSDTIIDDAINQAQAVIVNESWCLRTSTGYVLTAGDTFYNLPDDLITIIEVTFLNNSGILGTLDEISEKKLYGTNPNFENTGAGEPAEYFVRYSTYGANALEIAYIPVPTTTSTGTIRVYYYNQPTEMTSDSDVPFDGNKHLYPYHRTIVPYATFTLKLLEGKTEEAQTYYAIYEKELELMKERYRSKPNYERAIKAAPR